MAESPDLCFSAPQTQVLEDKNLHHSGTPEFFVSLLCPWGSGREIALRVKLCFVPSAVSVASFTSLRIQKHARALVARCNSQALLSLKLWFGAKSLGGMWQ